MVQGGPQTQEGRRRCAAWRLGRWCLAAGTQCPGGAGGRHLPSFATRAMADGGEDAGLRGRYVVDRRWSRELPSGDLPSRQALTADWTGCGTSGHQGWTRLVEQDVSGTQQQWKFLHFWLHLWVCFYSPICRI